MGPVERYRAELERPGFLHDPAQERAVAELQRVRDELTAPAPRGRLRRLVSRVAGDQPQAVTGLYLWGGVGRGKTHLMDLFFEGIPFENKLRTHFHRFKQRLHHELRDCAGEKNPLRLIGARIAEWLACLTRGPHATPRDDRGMLAPRGRLDSELGFLKALILMAIILNS